MNRLILHVGAPKTGSSAIQSFLCRYPVLDLHSGQTLTYGVVRKGRMLAGEDVRSANRFHPLGYLPSAEKLDDALGVLSQADGPETEVLLLSQESWSRQAGMLRDPGMPVDIVMFVRPQVEWLRSAWWQWFAWTNRDGNPLHAWRFLRGQGALDWSALAEEFRALDHVREVNIRLFRPDTDIVATFLDTIGAHAPRGADIAAFRRNASLTSHHLTLYRHMPWLRSANAAAMDAILTRLWPMGRKPPSPVNSELAAEIIETLRGSNEKLLSLLPEEDAEFMRNDPRWWNAESVIPA
ncbi:MAG: hypothetical protein AAGA69_07675 [Pseudomonadota bacterium]